MITDIAEDNRLRHTEDMTSVKEPTKAEISAAAAAMGRKGGKAQVPTKGFGSLSKKDRSKLSRAAALKRHHGEKKP